MHAGVPAGAGQFERQLGGMDDGAGVGAVQACEIGRRVYLVPHLVHVEQPSLAPGGGLSQPVDLMRFGGDRQHAGALPFRIESQLFDVVLHAVEVLQAHRVERVNLVGPS